MTQTEIIEMLGCPLVLAYANFEYGLVKLYFPAGYACDADGAIRLAQSWMADVRVVETFPNSQSGPRYVQRDGAWETYEPMKMEQKK